MTITINKKSFEVPDNATVLEALKAAGKPTTGIAVAIGGNVVPARELATRTVVEGDSLMVIKAFYGG